MKKIIYDNTSNEPRNWTTAQLKKTLTELHCSIFQVECYGVRDMILYDLIGTELIKRGVNVCVTSGVVFK